MSYILNLVKEKVQNAISVDVQQASYGKNPVLVKDVSNSVTAGWSLLYRVSPSKTPGQVYDQFGSFSELSVPGFSAIYNKLGEIYSRFLQGENVENKYNTQYAKYPDDKLWFTALRREKGVSITMTVVDDNSPFHMLTVNFYITVSQQNGALYLVGYDKTVNKETDVFTEKYNSNMLPDKKRFIPVEKDGDQVTASVIGTMLPNGRVLLSKDTKLDYIQEFDTDRRMLAGIYERSIMDIAFEKAASMISQLPAQQSFATGYIPQQQTWNANVSPAPAQPQGFGAPQQPQAFGQQMQPQAFGAPASGFNMGQAPMAQAPTPGFATGTPQF